MGEGHNSVRLNGGEEGKGGTGLDLSRERRIHLPSRRKPLDHQSHRSRSVIPLSVQFSKDGEPFRAINIPPTRERKALKRGGKKGLEFLKKRKRKQGVRRAVEGLPRE